MTQQADTQIPSGEQPARLLIVDDKPSNIRLLRDMLRQTGYDVRAVTDGPMALTAIAEEPPDLILLDINMPEMDGFQVARKLKSGYATRHIPIIFISALHHTDDKLEAFGAGGVDYITKPFEFAEVHARVRTHLELKRLKEYLEDMVEERTRELLDLIRAQIKFVPRAFIHYLEKESIADIRVGDCVEREMTILFADVRNFTTLSENLNPRENFEFVNQFLGRMSPIIASHGGFVDKFMGDAIMALFPDAVSAVKAGNAMLRGLREHNEEHRGDEQRMIHIGIGINTGRTMLGTVGDDERMEVTVISDAVNTASRLESLTKQYGVSMLLGERTHSRLDGELASLSRRLGRAKVKGKSSEIEIFEVFAADSPDTIRRKREHREQFERALESFLAGDYPAAGKAFRRIAAECADDGAADWYVREAELRGR